MKRIFAVLVAVCLILTSCGDTLHYAERENSETHDWFTYETSDDKWLENQTNYAMLSGLVGNGDYLYFSIGSAPVRYNTTTGNISYLCMDPLCFHKNQDCPFFGVGDSGFRAFMKNNAIYYPVFWTEPEVKNNRYTGESIKVSQFRRYDISSGRIETLVDDFSNGGIVAWMIGDDYLYCWHQKAEEGEPIRYYINQYNLRKGTNDETWLIAAMDGLKPYNFVSADSEMLYMSNYSEGSLYSVPHDNAAGLKKLYTAPEGYVINHAVFHDGSFLFVESNTEQTDCRLMRYDISGGTVAAVYAFDESLDYLYYTEKYVYFTYNNTKEIGRIGETGEVLTLSDTVIYRLDCTSDAPTEEKVFEFPAEMSTCSMKRFVVSGNYLYGYYITWGEKKEVYHHDDGYHSEADGVIMRIDLRSGEIYYIRE